MRLHRPRLEARARRLLRTFHALDRLELVPMQRLVELACERYRTALQENTEGLRAAAIPRGEIMRAQRLAADELRDQLGYHERLLRRCFRGHPGLGCMGRGAQLRMAPDESGLVH